jgi:hypothetical protein
VNVSGGGLSGLDVVLNVVVEILPEFLYAIVIMNSLKILCDVNFYFGREVVSCNEYECGNVPALNKLYWASSDPEDWPVVNDKFNCSKGYNPKDSPKGLTYYEVLADPQPSSHLNSIWYFLAKEWIASKLNLANGAQFSIDAIKLIIEAGELLENCEVFSDEEIPKIYALKEKLGRINNNIGGLQNVDSEMNLMLTGRNNGNGEEAANTRLTFILAIAVPLVAVLIVAIALGFTIYYVREKTAVANDKFESEDEEEPLQHMGRPTDQVPLEMEPLPPAKEDSSSEER